jgi:glutaredoxin 3
MGEVVVFSKPGCRHCEDAKALLRRLDIGYREVDITADLRHATLMTHLSGRHTVPQIFFNDRHIGGTSDLRALGEAAIREGARVALADRGARSILERDYDERALADEVTPIAAILAPHLPGDPRRIPEYAPVFIYYQTTFSFLPNLYEQMILRPDATSLWIASLASLTAPGALGPLGDDAAYATFAAAMTAGCAYCSAHTADLVVRRAGDSTDRLSLLADHLVRGEPGLESLPLNERQKAIVAIAGRSTTHAVGPADIERLRRVVGAAGLRDACHAIGGWVGIMGFFNRFNDMIGVEIEPTTKRFIEESALAAHWRWGTHDTEDAEDRYPYQGELQMPPPREGGPHPLIEAQARVMAQVAPILEKYEAAPDAQRPAWLADFATRDQARALGALYQSAFNAGEVDAEVKHLAGYALGLASGYPHIAAEERRIALLMGADTAPARTLFEQAETHVRAGTSNRPPGFTAQQALALRLAQCAARFPQVVRGALVRELEQTFTAAQIVELIICLATLGVAQRWLSVSEALAAYAQGSSSKSGQSAG